MYLSNRDIKWAIDCGHLIVEPGPEAFRGGYDESSIDLHLDDIQEAKIWDIDALQEAEEARGSGQPEVHIGRFNWAKFSEKYLMPLPELPEDRRASAKVFRRGREAIVKPGGFLLWQTKERIGTPQKNPTLICFVDGKSTRARTGILVHLTAPTIHTGWSGKIVLEIANLGPFHFVLQENDVIAQLTVASISSAPDLALKKSQSATEGQAHVSGKSKNNSSRKTRPRTR
jgi:deoxycytidine triphosphate deaminase